MKKIFIDAGACRGQSVDAFMKHWKDWEKYDIHSFEPYPPNFSYFDKYKSNSKFHFHKEAVWIYDGKINFYISNQYFSSSLIKEKDNVRKDNALTVPCVDISNWIKDNFSKDDYIILKMDTEGGEYETLDKLINDNTLEMVNELYIEFHTGKVKKTKEDDQLLLDRMEKFSNLKIHFKSGKGLNFIK